jgi:hypothetical protein
MKNKQPLSPRDYAIEVFGNFHRIESRFKVDAIECAELYFDNIIGIIDSLEKHEYATFLLKDKMLFDTEHNTHFHGYDLIEFMAEAKDKLKTI